MDILMYGNTQRTILIVNGKKQNCDMLIQTWPWLYEIQIQVEQRFIQAAIIAMQKKKKQYSQEPGFNH